MQQALLVSASELEALIKAAVRDELTMAFASYEVEDSSEWLNSREVCEHLGISRPTLSRWQNEGVIPFSRVGGRVFFRKDLIDDAITNAEKCDDD